MRVNFRGVVGGILALGLGLLGGACNDDAAGAATDTSDTNGAEIAAETSVATSNETADEVVGDTGVATVPDTESDTASDTESDTQSATENDTSQVAETANETADETVALGDYPAGPYGVTVGATIANMSWIGYANPTADAVSTTKPYATYTLDDARRSGARYAMINLAESLCPGCQKSAGEMAKDGPAVVAAGGVIIEMLETTGFFAQPSKSSLDAWVNKYKLPVTVVKDPDGSGTPTLDALGGREHAYIIDLSTMKILKIITGDNTGFGATSGGLGMAELTRLLAP